MQRNLENYDTLLQRGELKLALMFARVLLTDEYLKSRRRRIDRRIQKNDLRGDTLNDLIDLSYLKTTESENQK